MTCSVAPLMNGHPAARIAFYAPLAAFAVLESRVRLRSVLSRRGASVDRGSRPFVYLGIALGIVAAVTLGADVPAASIDIARVPLFVAGVALMVAGIVVRQWAVALLGGLFTTDVRIHHEQQVIDSGPYRWVRHPSYTGLLATCAGIGLAELNWASLAVSILLPLPAVVLRIRVEERALLHGLGEPYRRFAAGRARLLPGVW
jgi:protein-S-isoprenylcysteine O-methyltransferase Ste14